ncbi:efflux RND transporter permease subunit [Bradyrhizobium betae]
MAEVGNPTIVATLTVVAALLPMLFVSGLMGPIVAPIPANASAAMLFSFFVAMVVALADAQARPKGEIASAHAAHDEGRLGRLYRRFATPIVRSKRSAWIFLLGVGIATLLSMTLFATKSVTVKLLPFDNKSEIAVVVDLPEGREPRSDRAHAVRRGRDRAAITGGHLLQSYAGTPAPFNFSGLVRHYYLRERPELGEVQVNLAARGERKRASHEDRAGAAREAEGARFARRHQHQGGRGTARAAGAVDAARRGLRSDAATRRAVTAELKKVFAEVPFIVDIDDSIGAKRPRLRLSIDQDRLEFFGVEQRDVYDTIQTLFGGTSIGYSHRGEDRNPIEIAVHLGKRELVWDEALASTPVPANTLPGSKTVVELGQVVKATVEEGSPTIFRRDGRFADMVMAELAGRFEALLYGMLGGRRSRGCA